MIYKDQLRSRIENIDNFAINHLGEQGSRPVWWLTRHIEHWLARRQSIAENVIDRVYVWTDDHLGERQMNIFWFFASPISRLVYAISSPYGWRGVVCRWKGHPYSVGWYNASGFEPDMSCRNCGEDVG